MIGYSKRPNKSGLYDPTYEKDSCGVGFVCSIKGIASHDIIVEAAEMNCCMDHRGGVGYEENSGDGAGVLTAIPHKLFTNRVLSDLAADALEPGSYAVGNFFLPTIHAERKIAKSIFEKAIIDCGQKVLGWRKVPVDPLKADL